MEKHGFLSLDEYLFESNSSDNNFGCVILYADAPDWPYLTRRIVKEEDIFTASDDDYGYEDKAHVTILHGIHNDQINKNAIFNEIRSLPIMQIEIDNISIFENDRFDVVKFDIPKTSKLMESRKKFEQFAHTNFFPNYQPHATIAYVNKGMGKKYQRSLRKPIKLIFKTGVYSEPNYKKNYFDLVRKEYKK